MNKTNYLLIVLIFISNIVLSQSLETVMWGDKAELTKKTSFQKIAGVNADGFYAIRSNDPSHITKDKLWLEYISLTTLNVDESNEIAFPSIGGKQSYYEDIFYVNDKIILFTSIKDKSRNQKLLYISYLNTNGTLKNKPKEVGAIPISNFPEDDFEFKYLEDTKEIMVQYHKSFTQYNGEKYFIKIFDSNLKANFSEEFVFPKEFVDRKAEIVQVERGKSENIYFLIKEEQVKTRSSSTTKYDNVLLVYNFQKKEFKSYNIVVGKYYGKDLRFALDKDEVVTIAGTFEAKSSRTPGLLGGLFYVKVNPMTEKILVPSNPKLSFYDFIRDKKLLPTFSDNRTGETGEQRNSFKVNNIEMLENGGFMIVTEMFYESFREFKDPETKEIIKVKYYNYLDFLIGFVDKEGKFKWVKRFPKMQFSTKDDGYFSSYAIWTNVNTVKLMYNDDSKNIDNKNPSKTKTVKFNPKSAPKAVAIMHSIYTDGSEQKTTMFEGDDGKCAIVPRTFTHFSDGFLIYSLSGKEFRFCQFDFE